MPFKHHVCNFVDPHAVKLWQQLCSQAIIEDDYWRLQEDSFDYEYDICAKFGLYWEESEDLCCLEI